MEKKTDTLFASLLGIFMFFVPVDANAQNHVGNLTPYGEEFPNLKYPLPLTFWCNLST